MTGRDPAAGAPAERPAGHDPEITVRGDAEGVWHRVHPLTPFVRSWLLLVALVWGIGNAFVDDLVSSLVKHEPLEVNVSGAVEVVGLGLALAVLCGALGVLIALGLLSWWFIRYQITEDHVRFRSGWLFRTQRQARLDRVQGIDIERRFLPRILGLASLKFDVADGGSSVLELSYLGREHAQQLRRQLLVAAQRAATDHLGPASSEADRAAAGSDPGAGATVATDRGSGRVAPWALAPADGPGGVAHSSAGTQGAAVRRRAGVDLRMAEKYGLLNQQDELRRVFIVPTGRVLLGLVCSPPAVALVLIALITAGLALWFPEALIIVLPSAIAPLLGVLSGLYTRLERSWGFTLSEVPSGVRTRAGLFNERSSTIPTGRVQALQVTRPLLWRFFGGHRVVVTTAGKGGAGETEDLGSVVLPVGTWDNVQEILRLVLPLEHAPRDLVQEGLSGAGGSSRFTANPRRSWWLDPVTWRRNGFALDDSSLVLRWGRITRHACVVPHHKTQSVALRQGPVERRTGLSGVAVHVTPGAVTTSLDHLDVRTARELQWRHAQLSRAARERDAAGGSWAALPPEGSASEV
ncbi:PH domain-containing protein [Kocuria rhizophila]|uniref:PH domain-containing protein n=1 Tax=Kocuria rhizophila TaxID=72000 RepID=UPI00387A5651